MIIRRALIVGILVAASGLSVAGQSLQRVPAPAAPQVWRVIEPLPGLIPAAAGQVGMPVVVRVDLLRQAAASGGTIEIALPTGEIARAAVEWASSSDPAQLFIAGPLVDDQRGEVSLTLVGDTLAGRIVSNERLFAVRRAPNSALHVVSEIDPQQFPADAEPLIVPPTGALQPAAAPDLSAADTNDFVDLLVVYTPAARAAIGSTSAMVAEITGAVANANMALTDAGVKHRLRLVHNEEVAYTEGFDNDEDLDRLTANNDGFMDNVHTLRETHRADEVTLISANELCGLAWVMGAGNVNAQFQSSAFNIVHWSCANINLSLAHEIGHNMGLAHDRPNAGSAGAFDYAYGYSVAGVGRDVMSTASCTPSCPRRAIFSTPLRNFPGSATPAGTATEDNARALDNTSPTTANFRQSVTCTFSLSPGSAVIGLGGGAGNTVALTAGGGSCPAWTAVSNAGFITVTGGASGTGNGTVTYSVTALTSGTRTGTITIAGLTFTVTQGALMTLNRTTLSFGAVNTGGTLSNVTASQVARVAFSGGSPPWTVAPTVSWLQITGGSGTGSGQFTVNVVSAASLPATGTVTATIQVASGDAANSPQLITVRLTLFAATTTTTAPFGSFDTPIPGTVQGSIAVTGWALDDIEVSRVEIWRDLTTGETTTPFNGPGHPGHGKVFIANALFVPGARPDVESAYTNSPLAYRAGWGYLLLTWGLWNQGNGSFTLYAFAFDKDGKAATLGTKAIVASNSTATRPFGGIDTPAYGETVTTSFWNYGWALTPKANTADPRSCTITNGNVSVAIDSGPLTAVTYGGARPDIAGAFPGFSNGSSGGGAYYIDLTGIANGVHSIGWLATDNCGRAEGIGSRFFTVAK